MTVYILQEPTSEKDLTSAAQYGALKPILSSEDNPSKNVMFSMNKLYNALCNYNPEEDYICCPGGDPIVPLLAGATIERIGLEEVNYLVWNRDRDPSGVRKGTGFYVPKKIQIFNNGEEQ